jgi:hypothetical protein
VLYFQHDISLDAISAICVNFQDGRWKHLAEEPQRRVKEVLETTAKENRNENPLFLHLVLLTSVSKWWVDALAVINDQLIAYVRLLYYPLLLRA